MGQDTVFESFVKKKCATLFKARGENMQNAGKGAAEIHIRNGYNGL
jgi:hypothetical protein